MKKTTFTVEGKTLGLGQKVNYRDICNNTDAYVMGIVEGEWNGKLFEIVKILACGEVYYDTSKLKTNWETTGDFADAKMLEVLANVVRADKHHFGIN